MKRKAKNVRTLRYLVFILSLVIVTLNNQPTPSSQNDIQCLINNSSPPNSDWVEMKPSIAPPPRYHHWGHTAYDSESDRLILFSGDMGEYTSINDTWAYDYNTNTWENMTTNETHGRYITALAYDSESDRIILFGGSDKNSLASSTEPGETWSYDYNTNTWTNLTTPTGPPARGGHSMSYDEVDDRMIVYGGGTAKIYEDNLPFYQDTWAYDYNTNTWTNMSPSTNPGPLGNIESVYDVESDKTIIFGGKVKARPDSGQDYKDITTADTWAYDYSDNLWVKIDLMSPPTYRVVGMMAYNTEVDRICMFGGDNGNTIFGDTWAYDYNANTWTDMNSPSPPSARYSHTLDYDSESNVVILYGGVYLDETWAYHYQANVPSSPRSLQATLKNGEVNLTWIPPKTDAGSPLTEYIIYRGSGSDSLEIYRIIQDPETLEFIDTEVGTGTKYFYAIRAKNAIGESINSNVVEITIPSGVPGFSLLIFCLTLLICVIYRRK